MHDFQSLKSLIEAEINALQLEGNPKELYEPIRYSLSLNAKRVRPILTLAAAELFGGTLSKATKPALGMEVFHNFTLLHDDIMDNAPIRRSNPTVHARWGTNIAILSGDAMFVKACQLISEAESFCLKAVLDLFYATALEVCEGQQLDMNFEKISSIGISDYIEMIRLKTAVLLAACLKAGALMSAASKNDADEIYAFGENMGLAFQLRDDLLDVYGESKFGKRVGGDILSNKKTFMLLKAMEVADKSQKEKLDFWMSPVPHQEEDKVQAVTEIFNSLNIKGFTENEINFYYQKGLKNLHNISVGIERKGVLLNFTESLLQREI